MRAVILTGTDPSFSAGGDLRGMAATVHRLVDRSPKGATAMWRWIRYEFGGRVSHRAQRQAVRWLGSMGRRPALAWPLRWPAIWLSPPTAPAC